jgi:hypothetical protein
MNQYLEEYKKSGQASANLNEQSANLISRCILGSRKGSNAADWSNKESNKKYCSNRFDSSFCKSALFLLSDHLDIVNEVASKTNSRINDISVRKRNKLTGALTNKIVCYQVVDKFRIDSWENQVWQRLY